MRWPAFLTRKREPQRTPDLSAWWDQVEARLATRREHRAARSPAARKGASTKRHRTYARDVEINRKATNA